MAYERVLVASSTSKAPHRLASLAGASLATLLLRPSVPTGTHEPGILSKLNERCDFIGINNESKTNALSRIIHLTILVLLK